MRRIIRVFFIVCLFFLLIADKQTNCALAGNDEFVNRVEEDYFISAIIEEQWENSVKESRGKPQKAHLNKLPPKDNLKSKIFTMTFTKPRTPQEVAILPFAEVSRLAL